MPKSAIGPGDQDRLSCECGFHQSVLQVVKSPPDKTASTRRRSRGAPLDSPREIPSARRAQAPLSCAFDSVGGERDRAHGARSVPARRRSYEHPRPRAASRARPWVSSTNSSLDLRSCKAIRRRVRPPDRPSTCSGAVACTSMRAPPARVGRSRPGGNAGASRARSGAPASLACTRIPPSATACLVRAGSGRRARRAGGARSSSAARASDALNGAGRVSHRRDDQH
jgi:hypothetical protein